MPRSSSKLTKRFRRMMREIVNKQGGKCHWCQKDICVHGPRSRKISHTTIEFKSDGRRCLIATLEHITPVSKGGKRRGDILREWVESGGQITADVVAACYPCNTTRGNNVDWKPENDGV